MMTNSSIFLLTPLPLTGKYRPPSMPVITEETVDEILWASFEIPARQQVQQPPLLAAATTSTDIDDAYMIMSGEPPAMPVIPEETEEDLRRENFRVTPLTGKYRPPSMPVITEETHDEILWASFEVPARQQVQQPPLLAAATNTKYRLPSMPVITEETHDEILWASFDLPVQQQVQQTAAVLSGGNTTISPISSGSPPVLRITRGVYKGSTCTVVRCTAKMVYIHIMGESRMKRIMQTSLSF
jgi:hypothetical protein